MKVHDYEFIKHSSASRSPSRRDTLSTLLLLPTLPACLRQAYFTAGPVYRGRVAVPAEPLAGLKSVADVLFVWAEGVPGAIALRKQDSSYSAVLALCTHRSCELSAQPQGYDCPCHGSRFDLSGEVLEGPAERPLPSLPVRMEATGLSILLNGEGR